MKIVVNKIDLLLRSHPTITIGIAPNTKIVVTLIKEKIIIITTEDIILIEIRQNSLLCVNAFNDFILKKSIIIILITIFYNINSRMLKMLLHTTIFIYISLYINQCSIARIF